MWEQHDESCMRSEVLGKPDLRLDADVHINGQRSKILNHGFTLYGHAELITDQKRLVTNLNSFVTLKVQPQLAPIDHKGKC